MQIERKSITEMLNNIQRTGVIRFNDVKYDVTRHVSVPFCIS